jgi:hypothetical protein
MRYRLEVRLSDADTGKRVVIRWRRPAADGSEAVADVLGTLEAADSSGFTVRRASGEVVVVPRERALAGKPVPPAPVREPRPAPRGQQGQSGRHRGGV